MDELRSVEAHRSKAMMRRRGVRMVYNLLRKEVHQQGPHGRIGSMSSFDDFNDVCRMHLINLTCHISHRH